MIPAATSHSARSNDSLASQRMRADGVDRVSSMLLAVLVMVGCAVAILFVLWVTQTQLIPKADTSYPAMKLVSSSASASSAWEFQVPSKDETIALDESSLQQLVEQVGLVELDAVTPNSETIVGSNDAFGTGATGTRSVGDDDRLAAGQDIVPNYLRWHLIFKSPNRAAYAKQLDWLGIELGVFGGGVDGIDYVAQMSGKIVSRHEDQSETEQRIFFSWLHTSPMAYHERDFCMKAGVPVDHRQIVKFVPVDLEKQLAQLELEYALSHGVTGLERLEKTVFEIQEAGDGFRFVVVDQRYRDST